MTRASTRIGERRPPVAERHYRFFGGKGGVGKTTCAAAVAIDLAEAGRRVLLVSTDPAHSLADVLDQRLTSRIRRVPTRRGSLHAVELDADAALDRWIGERRPALKRILSRGTYLDDDDIEQLLRLALPGVDELIGLFELARLARSGPYEEVVVDTAPTGHTVRLLAMPGTLKRIATVFDDMQAKHRFLSESFGGRYRPDAADAVIQEIGSEAEALERLLRDPARAVFSWALVPEPVVLEEARRGVSALLEKGIVTRDIVVNRVTPMPRSRCDLCEQRMALERPLIAAVGGAFPNTPVRLLPAVTPEPRGLRALRPIGRRLEGPAQPRGLRASGRLRRARPLRPRAGPDQTWLSAIAPARARLLMFAGKGGVGKTTCAASVALALAKREPGRRILLLSVDPAHSLGDVLDAPVDDHARHVPGEASGLHAREVDAGRLFATKRERYLRAVDNAFAALRGPSRFDPAYDRVVVEDLIDLAPPGIDELFGVLSVIDALAPRDGNVSPYDTVVVDTAPTGHALRLLRMPQAALEWVHAFMALLLKYRKVIGLGELGQDLMDTSRDLKQLGALLRDCDRARVVVVTRAEELPRLETGRLVSGLEELDIALSGVIVNATTPPGCARCRRTRATEREVIARLRGDLRHRAGRACAIIEAPIVLPSPRGRRALIRFHRTWRTLDA